MVARRWAVLLASCVLACRAGSDLDTDASWPTPRHGAVVSEHPLASAVGVEVLERGGNAVDAAVASALALAVVLPRAGNLGGGGFALWVPHEGEPRSLDFRERAPDSTSPEIYLDGDGNVVPERSRTGPWSVGVPGTPAGLWELHRELGSGRWSFEDLAQPAIDLARDGFTVDPLLARSLTRSSIRGRIERDPVARATFYPDGLPLLEGERLVQPELADTLALFARSGPRDFYTGPMARLIVRSLYRAADIEGVPGDVEERARGLVSPADLEAYVPVWRTPLVGWFRGYEVITMPPPSSGGIILLQVLSVLDGFPLDGEREATLAVQDGQSAADVATAESSGLNERVTHWWIEAYRRSFAERAFVMGDPDYTPVPVDELLSSEWIARARIGIGDEADAEPVRTEPVREGTETTHLSVIDEDGNAVSLTTTLNSSFGSGLMVEGAGFMLNNELDDFAIAVGAPNLYGLVGNAANAIEPGKRPLSSMTPTVLREGGNSVSLVLGSPGGPRIISAVCGVLLRTLVYGETLDDAVRAPRLHQQWSPQQTYFEEGWSQTLLDGLRRRGHEIEVDPEEWASVQALRVHTDGKVVGASDPRRGGEARLQGVGRRR